MSTTITSGDSTSLSPAERKAIHLLVVEPEPSERESMRRVIAALGYGSFHFSNGHAEGLSVMGERRFTHIIFSVRATNMSGMQFLDQVMKVSSQMRCIAASSQPQVDDVFSLLQRGARAYLVKPFSFDSIDSTLTQATKGEPFSEVILRAKDRNEAFSALIAGNLDKVSMTLRQSKRYETAKMDLMRNILALRGAVSLAKTFCQGGEATLLNTMVDFFINLSEGPASRLGRLRHKLKKDRSVKGTEIDGE